MMRPLKCGGTIVGKIRIDGMPAAMEMAAAQPAWAADMPLSSNIFGSQLEKPWPMANDNKPMNSKILTFLILMRLANTSRIRELSDCSAGLSPLANSSHCNAIEKVVTP